MTKNIVPAVVAISFGALPLLGQSPSPSPEAPPTGGPKPHATPVVLPPQPPDVPAPKLISADTPNPGFLKRHENYVQIARQNKAGVLFLGDSITDLWGTKGREVWEKEFASYHPANFGISGDRTQHVLWRVTNGELDGFTPKVIVLLIGTNNMTGPVALMNKPNMGGDTVEGIASGVTKIVEVIRQKVPSAKIILCGIFPRGETPGALRDKVKQVNALIEKLGDGKCVFYLDFSDKFLDANGEISKEALYDNVHPTAQGYQIWADAIKPKLEELLK